MLFLISLVAGVAAEGPCDILDAAGNPCVAAHSTVRALYTGYTGALYEVERGGGAASVRLPPPALLINATASGFADSGAQDAFCGGASCVISRIFDQSGNKNHLETAPAGGAHGAADNGANATALRLIVSGHAVYGAYFEHGSGPGRAHSGTGYRCDNTTGVAKGDEAETIYMVTSVTRYNGGCCFDYGNAETNNHDDGVGTMEAVYWGNISAPAWSKGVGQGPWVMADLESGVWVRAGGSKRERALHAVYCMLCTVLRAGSG